MGYIFYMKTIVESIANRNKPPKKRSNVNSEVVFKAKERRGASQEKYDSDRLSEDDLDGIMAVS